MGAIGHHWGARFQEAALNPALWMDALQDLADATGSARGQLIGIGRRDAVPFNWVNDFSQRALDDFVRIGGAQPTVNYRIAADTQIRLGEIAHEGNYAQARASLRSDVYLDFCRDYDIPNGCQTALLAEEGALIGLALLRTERDGTTSEEQRAVFAEAAGAARCAVRLQLAIEDQAHALARGSLDVALGCHLLLDHAGRVRTMTASAEALIARGAPLSLIDGRLASPDPRHDRALSLAVARVLHGATQAQVALGRGLFLDLFALGRREWTLGFAPQIIAVVRDRTAEQRAQVAAAGVLFGLSPAECEIATMLTEGMTRDAISTARHTTAETTKSQIRSIYQKVGCTREAELAAIIAGLRDPD